MRWTGVFGYLAAVVVAILLLSRWLGWTGWLLVISIVLAFPVFVGLASRWGHPFRWSSALAFASTGALLGSLVSQYANWIEGRNSLLLLWTVLLLAVSITLFSHPMRGPAWGLFVGFWGTVAVIWLIVLQALAVIGFLHGSAYSGWVAWPLAITARHQHRDMVGSRGPGEDDCGRSRGGLLPLVGRPGLGTLGI